MGILLGDDGDWYINDVYIAITIVVARDRVRYLDCTRDCGVFDKRVISHSMMTLMDWGIVRRYAGNLGKLMPGRAGFLWEIAEDHIHRMKPLYEEHWKNFRQVYTLNGKTY